VSGKLDKHGDLSNFNRLAMPVDQSRVHQDFMVARQLISNRINYRSSHKLFLHMALGWSAIQRRGIGRSHN
jgi:hypothetical protein